MKNMRFMLLVLALTTSMVLAAPGAHGPNGEHLDAPSQQTGNAPSAPRTETFTENFELVATLYSTELSVLVDEYTTNAPVLNANLELEVGEIKTTATFHQDAGDYAFDNPALLAQLNKAGTHELIFTLSTPNQTDLLLASLNSSGEAAEHVEHGHVHGESHPHHHGHLEELLHSPYTWLALGLVVLVLVLVIRKIRYKS